MRKSVAPGVYLDDETGVYWARPWINKRRTWRRLKAVKEREAIREANTVEFRESKTFSELAKTYIEAGCPGRRLEARSESYQKLSHRHIKWLDKFFGRFEVEEIKQSLLLAYKEWRVKFVKFGKDGLRTVDTELITLSSILTFGVATDWLPFNRIRQCRPIFHKTADISRSRSRAPESADELHAIARDMLASRRTEVVGWYILFAAMTGCRKSELLRLKFGAKTPDDPGFISGNYLFLGRRSKRGVNPWVLITPEFNEMMAAHRNWAKERYPKSLWFFPGRDGKNPVLGTSIAGRMIRYRKAKSSARRTPHGLRAFYVTKRRSDGATDAQIAAEIGDASVHVISMSYGGRPPNWEGMSKMSFIPSSGEPAWSKWTQKWSDLESEFLSFDPSI